MRIAQELHNVILDETTGVYVSAVLEYLTAEILELSGNAARDNATNVIIPRHIFLAIAFDVELYCLFKDIVIYEGGRKPHVLGNITAQHFPYHARNIIHAHGRTTWCIDPSEMNECILKQMWSLRPGRNISQDALKKIHAATEAYLCMCLENAGYFHCDDFHAKRTQLEGEGDQQQLVPSLVLPEHVEAGSTETIFANACNKGDEATVVQLLAQGFDTTKLFHDVNWHFLQGAIASRSLSIVKLLLNRGIDTLSTYKAACTAAVMGDVDALLLILDHGLDINYIHNQTLISVACCQSVHFAGCLDVVELLLLRGAEPGLNGQTDLDLLQPEQRERMEIARDTFLNPGLK